MRRQVRVGFDDRSDVRGNLTETNHRPLAELDRLVFAEPDRLDRAGVQRLGRGRGERLKRPEAQRPVIAGENNLAARV